MSRLSSSHIKPGYYNGDSQAFYIRAEEGYLNARFTGVDKRYEIDYYEVESNDKLGKGYGKDLLQVAKEHARTIGAVVISASRITSGESVGAIAAVFGTKSVIISQESGRPPVISMKYLIREDDPTMRDDIGIGKKYESQSARKLAGIIRVFDADIALFSTHIHATDAKIEGKIWKLSEQEYFDYRALKDLRDDLLVHRDSVQAKLDDLEF